MSNNGRIYQLSKVLDGNYTYEYFNKEEDGIKRFNELEKENKYNCLTLVTSFPEYIRNVGYIWLPKYIKFNCYN